MNNISDAKIKIINLLETSKRLAETFILRFAEQDGAYLQPLIEALSQAINQINQLSDNDFTSLSEDVKQIISTEEKLRQDNKIGVRYSVIAAQIKNIQSAIDESSKKEEKPLQEEVDTGLHPDQQYIYLHLYNSLGGKLASWQQMINPKSMADHSVNRPIYHDAEHVEELIRSKPDIDLHAYLKIIVKKDSILMPAEQSVLKDHLGHPLLRLKHGAIKMEDIVSLHHKGKVYYYQNSKLIPAVSTNEHDTGAS